MYIPLYTPDVKTLLAGHDLLRLRYTHSVYEYVCVLWFGGPFYGKQHGPSKGTVPGPANTPDYVITLVPEKSTMTTTIRVAF